MPQFVQIETWFFGIIHFIRQKRQMVEKLRFLKLLSMLVFFLFSPLGILREDTHKKVVFLEVGPLRGGGG